MGVGSTYRTKISTTPGTLSRRSLRARTRNSFATGRWWNGTPTASSLRSPDAAGPWTVRPSTSVTASCERSPVFDSPTTGGLFDPSTGVDWSADTFATPLPDPQVGVADLDPEFWSFGLAMFALGAVNPWLSLVDEAKYGQRVDLAQSLEITTIACCHSPVIEGPFIERAFARIGERPSLPPLALPGQSVLDQIIAASALPQK